MPDSTLSIALYAGALVLGLMCLTLFVLATTGHVFYHHRSRRELWRPSALLLVLLTLQITLGALTVLSRKDVIINTSHVATGALVLATSLVLTLRTHRIRFGTSVPAAPLATAARSAALDASRAGARA